MKKVFLALAATCLFHFLAASCAFAEGAVAEPVAAVVLPPGYYPVEYVDVTNGAVLDTGVVITDEMKIRFKFAMLGRGQWLGSMNDYKDDNSITTRIIYFDNSPTDLRACFMTKGGGGGLRLNNVISQIGDVIEGYIQKDYAKLNNAEGSMWPATGNGNVNTFKCTSAGANLPARLWYLAIERKTPELGYRAQVRNLVPCRNAEGVVGCFDIAHFEDGAAAFYTNSVAAAPDFVAGPDLEGFVVSPIPPQTYTGSPLEPELAVRLARGGALTELTEGEDYEVAFTNNIRGHVATVTVTGKGEYADVNPVSASFLVVFPDYRMTGDYVRDGLVAHWDAIDNVATGTHDSEATNWIDKIGGVAFNGAFTIGEKTVVPTANLTVSHPGLSWNADGESLESLSYQTAGTAIRGASFVSTPRISFGYMGAGGDSFTLWMNSNQGKSWGRYYLYEDAERIAKQHKLATRSATYVVGPVEAAGQPVFYYDGEEVTTSSKNVWSENVSAHSNVTIYACTTYHSIRIYDRVLSAEEAAYNYAVDQKRFFGNVAPLAALSRFEVQPIPAHPLTGGEIVPDLAVTFQGDGEPVPLTKGVDYQVTCENNVEVGTATVKVSGIGTYKDEVPTYATFEIIDASFIIAPISPQAYTGEPIEPALNVQVAKNGVLTPLTKGRDYEARFANNVEDKTAFVTIAGIGEYQDIPAVTVTFTIELPNYRFLSTYVDDGLVAHWDAIDNLANGTHDTEATRWVDKIGGVAFEGAFTIGEKTVAPKANITTVFPGLLWDLPASTVEMLSYRTDGTAGRSTGFLATPRITFSYMDVGGDTFRLWVCSSDGRSWGRKYLYEDAERKAKQHVLATRSASYVVGPTKTQDQPIFYYDGQEVADWEFEEWEDPAYKNADVTIFSGTTFHSIRIYNRVLTAEEVAYNYAVDQKRFFGNVGPIAEFSKIKVKPLPAYMRTGDAIVPELEVTFQGDGEPVVLTEGVDYRAVYENNVENGMATIKINGLGEYKDEIPGYAAFEIVEPFTLEVAEGPAVTWAGAYAQPRVTFKLGGEGNYSAAKATISLTTNGTDWCCVSETLSGLVNGQEVSYVFPRCFHAGGNLKARVDIVRSPLDIHPESEPVAISVAPEAVFVDSACASPTAPYTTRGTAAPTIREALAALTDGVGDALVPEAQIRICRGTHTESGVELQRGVRIVGDTGNPKDVTIVDDVVGSRAFTLTHEDAVVRDLTISGHGWNKHEGRGGHVWMSAGTVENCVLKDGCAGGYSGNETWSRGYGGNVCMSGGRLARCQIRSGKAVTHVGTTQASYGSGVYATGGLVENCLICDNDGSELNTFGGGLCADGPVTVVNCTFAGNKAGYPETSAGGIQLINAAARVVNCVFFGNGGDARQEFGGDNLAQFSFCASSVTNDQCATWKVIDETAFASWAAREGDVRALMPRGGKPLCGTGTDGDGYSATGAKSSVDLRGRRRQVGKRLDIGCLEAQSGGALIVR